VGHGAVVHCKKIGNNVLIGNNATVLDNAEIGEPLHFAAGSVVAPDNEIPAESFAVRCACKIKGKIF